MKDENKEIEIAEILMEEIGTTDETEIEDFKRYKEIAKKILVKKDENNNTI